jgi:dihydroorotase
MFNRVALEDQVRKSVVGAFDRAENFVEGLRPVLHEKVNDLREPVVNFVTTTVDSALEIRERGENLAATVQRDALNVRRQAEGWVKKIIKA